MPQPTKVRKIWSSRSSRSVAMTKVKLPGMWRRTFSSEHEHGIGLAAALGVPENAEAAEIRVGPFDDCQLPGVLLPLLLRRRGPGRGGRHISFLWLPDPGLI